jgi:oxygen-independent coproporphyrinogen-3 oxidase
MRGIELTEDDVIRRTVISRLLCHCVLDKKDIESEFNLAFDDYFAEELARLEILKKDGLVNLSENEISVAMLGRIFIRNIGMIFDKHLQKPKNKPVFSKTL